MQVERAVRQAYTIPRSGATKGPYILFYLLMDRWMVSLRLLLWSWRKCLNFFTQPRFSCQPMCNLP